jgi:hypothetical protein
VLLERDGSTLPDLLRLYADESFRREITKRARNPVVRRYWLSEFDHYPDRYRLEVVAPIQNKLGALLSDPTLYRILVAPKVDLRLRSIMDEGGVLLVNLSKGQLGEDSATTLGGLLVSTLGLAALSRADAPADTRRPFYAYVDEFQSFTTLAFATMLAEVRKYGLGLTIAHQYLAQLEPGVRHAVLAGSGTVAAFRVGAEDAAILAREFQPAFGAEDLLTLPNRHFHLKLLIEGAPSRPFSARTIAEAAGPKTPPRCPLFDVAFLVHGDARLNAGLALLAVGRGGRGGRRRLADFHFCHLALGIVAVAFGVDGLRGRGASEREHGDEGDGSKHGGSSRRSGTLAPDCDACMLSQGAALAPAL